MNFKSLSGNRSSLDNKTSYNLSSLTNGTNSNGSSHSNDASQGPTTIVALIIVFVFLGVLSFLITATNSSVIYFVHKKRYLKTTTNITLASLAASDLLAGVLAIPLIIVCNFNHDVCTAMDLTSRFISYSTVLHLLVVTLERYFMIVHAMKYKLWINKRRIRRVLAFIWVFSAFTSLIQLAWIDLQRGGKRSEATRIKDLIYGLVSFFGIVVLSLVVMTFSLCRIFVVLQRQLRDIKRLNASVEKPFRAREKKIQRKAAIIFSAMLAAFTACWFTYFLDGIRNDLNLEAWNLPFWAQVVLMFLRFSTALFNPLLYTFIKEDFKRAMNLPFLRYDEVPGSFTSHSPTVGTSV